jgi:cytochrome c-type biogenesis protein
MNLVDLIVLPIAFGLIGFVEPCSVAANLTFLSYVEKGPPGRKPAVEAIKFALSRSLFLGLVGAAVGLVGSRVLVLQSAYSIGIGLLFILLGVVDLAAHRVGWQLPALDISRWLRYRPGKSWAMGILFGLTAPACSTPLLLALLGKGAAHGAGFGFASLSLFGLALSAPLVAIAQSTTAREYLKRIGRWVAARKYLVSIMLILIGSYTVREGWLYPR